MLDFFTPGVANIDRHRTEHPEQDRMVRHLEEKEDRLFNEVEGQHVTETIARTAHLDALASEANPAVAKDPVKLAAAKQATATKRKALDAAASASAAVIARRHLNAERTKDARNLMAQARHLDVLDPIKVTAPDDGDWRAAIARLEAVWQSKRARRSAIAEGDVTPDEVLRPFRARVLAIMEQGRPDVSITGRGVSVALPTVPAPWDPSQFAGKGDLAPRMIDVEAIMYRYHGEAILNDVEAAVDEHYASLDPDTIMPAAERRSLLAKLDREIDRAGRELAAAIWASIDAGLDLDFPEDLPTKAVLGIA